MKCPFCGGLEDKVIDSRTGKEGEIIRRRRECLSCGERFTTYEYIDEISPAVAKSDSRRESYDRNKLIKSIRIACTKRPVSEEMIDEMVKRIEEKISNQFTKEVKSKYIGELVMKELRNCDEVAYVRFASVYRNFKDKEEFVRELEKLKKHISSPEG